MNAEQPIFALGLISGTSGDGMDAALIRADGQSQAEIVAAGGIAYSAADSALARLGARVARQDWRQGAPMPEPLVRLAAMTQARAQEAAHALAQKSGVALASLSVIGFHGQTVLHDPAGRRTEQVGDGAQLAEALGVPVAWDFRSRDVALGGQGAPLAPGWHWARARAEGMVSPVVLLNLGGVANLTWISDGPIEETLGFDVSPANGLLDDWAMRHTGTPCDVGGALARAGQVDAAALACLLDHPGLVLSPPKSFDRDDFDLACVEGLAPADGAATLTAFTAQAVARAMRWVPSPPRRVLALGGGRRNPALMAALAKAMPYPVVPAEAVGWNGDSVEAEAFAFLAVRVLRGLPITWPRLTGVAEPSLGGTISKPGSKPGHGAAFSAS